MKSTLASFILSCGLLFVLVPMHAQEQRPAPHGPKPPTAKSVRNVGVEEFDKLRADKNAVVLDVRTKKEFEAGHIPGAMNLDINAPDFQENVAKLDKSKTYLIHCAAGVRSAKACNAMDKLSFTNLVNLDPGLNAWQKAGKPIEKK
jgi:rhodanese-related sulfurtransferase